MSTASKVVRAAGKYGLYSAARLLTARQPRILMYHRFTEAPAGGEASRENFRKQVAHIRRYYQPMTLETLCGYLESEQRVPRNAIVITVDDGYRDFYDIAWPVLREHSVPATLFVTTGFVSGDLWLWPDKISWILEHAGENNSVFQWQGLRIEENELKTNSPKIWKRLISFLLAVPDAEKHEVIAALADAWGLELPENAPERFAACTWEQLRELQAAGIEIGGHTVTHPTLGQVNSSHAELEIRDCRARLAEELGREPFSFCYPNGMPDDFSADLMKQVEKNGFRCAVAAFSDAAGMKHRFALRRHSSGNNWFQFCKAVSGVELIGHYLRGQARVHY
ncbi:polysaccharide deacetylase [Marinobacter vulgaris]|uniref:Polysaccharide deacetylase n=2 Tax=Marinobacter vulgaris TaxID=1928331 RepID=A0A2V3ZJX9_9GAMM|nr:polysaccharide deacetylase family protein [Marinobacter vulgaris]PXX90720.1 polysaccharide deacetylase [Marinobacter vulgaris]TSJ70308.1 polysaccharide deacetylase family protein [Marinobacter vulgaris]